MMTKQTTDLHHALIGGQARIVSANLTQTIEALEFLKRRFERDRQMMTDLSQAPDSAAAVAVLTAFYQRSLSDYVAEAAQLKPPLQHRGHFPASPVLHRARSCDTVAQNARGNDHDIRQGLPSASD